MSCPILPSLLFLKPWCVLSPVPMCVLLETDLSLLGNLNENLFTLKQKPTVFKVFPENWGVGWNFWNTELNEAQGRGQSTCGFEGHASESITLRLASLTKQITQIKDRDKHKSWGNLSLRGEKSEKAKDTESIPSKVSADFASGSHNDHLYWPFENSCFYPSQSRLVRDLFPLALLSRRGSVARVNHPGFLPTPIPPPQEGKNDLPNWWTGDRNSYKET